MNKYLISSINNISITLSIAEVWGKLLNLITSLFKERYVLGHATCTRLCVITFLFLGELSAQNTNPAVVFQEANNLYDSTQYQEAKQLYSNLLAQDYVSPELYYNLGNTHFKLHEYAKAILYYEKALKAGFNKEKVKANLTVTRKRITDKHEESRAGFGQWLSSFVGYSVDFWTWISLLFLLAALLAFIFSKRLVNDKFAKIARAKFMLFLGLFVLFTIVAIIKYGNTVNPNSGIVMQSSFTVKSEPNFASESSFVLHEGSKVVILDKKDDWYEIRFGANVGWIEQNVIELI